MRVPLSWLGDFLPLATDPTDRESLRELGRAFDSLGLVVEGIEPVGAGLGEVVLARVLEIRPIPGADRIRQVLVDAGGPAPTEVVCGAWNFSVGDVVPLARVGAELPNGMTIGRRKMRGVVSEGMLCSPPELGLPGEGAGLLVLASAGADGAVPAGIEPGRPLAEHLGIEPDAVFDLAIEANRPDALSVAGIARDLAARLRLPFSLPEISLPSSGRPAGELASVAVHAPEACGRLTARVLTGYHPVASPPLVARRLVLAGMRPLGAVVDATNYAMLELGQPTHAYDLERLGGRAIAVRLARPGELLRTLDGVERLLGRGRDALGREREVEEAVIVDGEDVPVGLAGVMGGAETEVAEATTSVLLEAAHFSPVLVGRGAKRQGLRSEASARFERGVDPEGTLRGADRVLQLVLAAAEAAGAPAPVVAPGVLEDRPVPFVPTRITLRTARMNGLLGTTLSREQAALLLAPLGFASVPVPDGLEVEVPSFRPDAVAEVDVIEEVARLHGYEHIAPTPRRSPRVGRLRPHQVDRRRLLRLLAGVGALECWTSSIVDPTEERRLGGDTSPVRLANPIAQEETVLRTSLLPGLCGALRHNVARRNPAVRLFELGAVFAAATAEGRPPAESTQAGLLLAAEGDDAGSAMACWERVVEGLGLEPAVLGLEQGGEPVPGETSGSPFLLGLHPSRRGLLSGPDGPFGALGELDPAVLEAFEAGGRRVGFLVLDLAGLSRLPRRDLRARPVSRFPSSDVDLAFVLPDAVPAGRLGQVLAEAGGDRLESVRLLDVYRGPGLEPGTRSLAYRLRLCALDHTLGDAELAELRLACIEAAESTLPARLRS